MKIQAKDLRIGNIFNEGVITEISHNTCKTDVYKKTELLYSEIEPIPLTEEWLLKFGFDEDNHGFLNNGVMELGHITTEDNYQYEYKGSLKFQWTIIDIKYVHQ